MKVSKAEQEEAEEVHFQIASSDGSRVFFTDTVSLTAESTPENHERRARRPVRVRPGRSGRKTPVQPHGPDGRPALAVRRERRRRRRGAGRRAMTAPRSTSSPTASSRKTPLARRKARRLRPPHEPARNPRKRECNLYLEHYNGESKTWEEPQVHRPPLPGRRTRLGTRAARRSLGGLTSRVSPNGRLRGVHVEQVADRIQQRRRQPRSKRARDEEVFLYDANTHRLVVRVVQPLRRATAWRARHRTTPAKGLGCSSIARGSGVTATEDRWLAGSIPGWTPLEPNSAPYQSRYLSDSGRLFFNGADALVPQDTNGKEDVYQYEPAGLGSCEQTAGCVALSHRGIAKHESAFLDASASGDDVFFVTAGQLVATDRDNSFDVYDARVCTESSPCLKPPPPPPAPCGSEASCRPPAPAAQGSERPRAPTFSGPGNVGKLETLAVSPKDTKPKPLTKRPEARKSAEDMPQEVQARKEEASRVRNAGAQEVRGRRRPRNQAQDGDEEMMSGRILHAHAQPDPRVAAAGVLLALLAGATPAMRRRTRALVAARIELRADQSQARRQRRRVIVTASNLGDATVDGSKKPVIITDTLPPGLTATAIVGSVGAPPSRPVAGRWPAHENDVTWGTAHLHVREHLVPVRTSRSSDHRESRSAAGHDHQQGGSKRGEGLSKAARHRRNRKASRSNRPLTVNRRSDARSGSKD